MSRKQTTHYVNNEEFLKALIDYKQQIKEAKKEKKEKTPKIPDYIGECFMKIATHLSYKPNFINYTFRDDMIADGVENCLQYVNNFDPNKSQNPFAYFTQIVWYAFLRRIAKEKRQLYIKYKSMDRSGILEQMSSSEGHYGKQNKIYENMSEFIRTYEESIAEQKEKAANNKKANEKRKKNQSEKNKK